MKKPDKKPQFDLRAKMKKCSKSPRVSGAKYLLGSKNKISHRGILSIINAKVQYKNEVVDDETKP